MQAGRAVAGLAQEIYVREENTGNMISGSAIIPHPDKANRIYDLEPKLGGEDSYFINSLFKTKNRLGAKRTFNMTHEQKEKISASKIAKKRLGSNNKNSKQIISIDKNGAVESYANTRCATEELELKSKAATGNICSCANGKLKTAYGYIWEYV